MKTEQEQIEEITSIIDSDICDKDCSNRCPYCGGLSSREAEKIYNAGYRKVGKDEIVVKKSEQKQWLKDCIESNKKTEEIARKETAREILDMLYDMGIDNEILECCRICDVNGVSLAKQICEKYGLEIEK